MEKLKSSELERAMNRIARIEGNETQSADGMVWPHDWNPAWNRDPRESHVRLIPFPGEITEETWNAHGYNPPAHMSEWFPEADERENVRPKPTWAEIIIAFRDSKLKSASAILELYKDQIDEHRKAVTDETALEIGAKLVHIGDGINHMTGLMHMNEQGTAAGRSVPRVTMRLSSGEGVTLYSQRAIGAVLDRAADRENAVESAHNVLMGRYLAQAAIRDDTDRSLDDREAAEKIARAIILNYESRLRVEVENYKRTGLPDDLPTLKEVLIERLESVATGHQKHLKGALSQQAIDNWAACVDMDAALTEVAKRCVLGVMDIEALEDAIWLKTGGAWARVTNLAALPASEEHEGDEAPAASLGSDGEYYRQRTGLRDAVLVFGLHKERIESVTAANIPTWTVTPHASQNHIEHTHGDTAKLSNVRKCIVDCKQIAGVEGRVVQRIPQARYADGSPAPLKMRTLKRTPGHSTGHSAVIELAAGETKPVTVAFTGRNLCGPSSIKVTLVPPAE